MSCIKELLRLWVKSYGITVHSSESSQIWYYINFAQFIVDLKVDFYLSAHVHKNFADYLFIYINFFIHSTVLASFIIQFLLFKH